MKLERIEVPREAHPAPCEEREAPRFTLLIRAAKLIAAQGEFICVIRDVSQTGISLRGFHVLPVGEPLWLELQTGERYALEPVWSRGLEAGFRFIHAVEVSALVAEAGCFPKRQLRLNIAFAAELAFVGGRVRPMCAICLNRGPVSNAMPCSRSTSRCGCARAPCPKCARGSAGGAAASTGWCSTTPSA